MFADSRPSNAHHLRQNRLRRYYANLDPRYRCGKDNQTYHATIEQKVERSVAGGEECSNIQGPRHKLLGSIGTFLVMMAIAMCFVRSVPVPNPDQKQRFCGLRNRCCCHIYHPSSGRSLGSIHKLNSTIQEQTIIWVTNPRILHRITQKSGNTTESQCKMYTGRHWRQFPLS